MTHAAKHWDPISPKRIKATTKRIADAERKSHRDPEKDQADGSGLAGIATGIKSGHPQKDWHRKGKDYAG